MCGRFFIRRDAQQLADYFAAMVVLPALPPSWNIAPTQSALVLRYNPADGKRHISPLRWGLVPQWAPDPSQGARLINARAESLAERSSFRNAFIRRRCIIPADGFYEWRHEDRVKQAYAVALTNGMPMALAGLWEGWKSPEGNWIRSFSVVTTEANCKQALVHQRMPAILPAEAWSAWLGEKSVTPEVLHDMLKPCPSEWLSCWPVSMRVGKVHENDALLLQRDPTASPPPELDDHPVV